MSDELDIRALDEKDRPYVLSSWRESHHQTPKVKRYPWPAYKVIYGTVFEKLLLEARVLGAYRSTPYAPNELLGFIVFSPGRRVHTLHWVQTKFKDSNGAFLRRRGIMTELLAAAQLGKRFAYTLRARKEKNTTLDEILAKKLLELDAVATYVPLLDWIK